MNTNDLRNIRRAQKITQAELAQLSGLTERTIQNLEAGQGNAASLSAALTALGWELDPPPSRRTAP